MHIVEIYTFFRRNILCEINFGILETSKNVKIAMFEIQVPKLLCQGTWLPSLGVRLRNITLTRKKNSWKQQTDSIMFFFTEKYRILTQWWGQE